MPKENMTTDNSNEVGETLALLSETLVDEEKRIRDEGADAMKSGSPRGIWEISAKGRKSLGAN